MSLAAAAVLGVLAAAWLLLRALVAAWLLLRVLVVAWLRVWLYRSDIPRYHRYLNRPVGTPVITGARRSGRCSFHSFLTFSFSLVYTLFVSYFSVVFYYLEVFVNGL